MQEGKALFHEKKFKEAAPKFAKAASRWPDSPLEEDALFLQGESEFFADLYAKAHDTYGGLLKKYSNTRHLDTVAAREFAIGRYWEQKYNAHPSWPITPNLTDSSLPRFGTFSYAIQAYERVRMNDPTGPLADSSVMALGNAYFRQGQYDFAAEQYDVLRKEYPNSQHQVSAHLLDLQAKMRLYQGTAYDRHAAPIRRQDRRSGALAVRQSIGRPAGSRPSRQGANSRGKGQSRFHPRRILRKAQILWRRSGLLSVRDRRVSHYRKSQAGPCPPCGIPR